MRRLLAITIVLLMAGTAFAQSQGVNMAPPVQPGQLNPYTGPVSITGNGTGAANTISQVGINGKINPTDTFYGMATGNTAAANKTALQKAVNAAASGQVVEIPAGNYHLACPVTIPNPSNNGPPALIGMGWTGGNTTTPYGTAPTLGGTVLVFDDASCTSGNLLDYEPGLNHARPLMLQGIGIIGPGSGTETCVQYGDPADGGVALFGVIQDVAIVNCSVGLNFNAEDTRVDGLSLWGDDTGLVISQSTANQNKFTDSRIQHNATYGANISNGYENVFRGGVAEGNGTSFNFTSAASNYAIADFDFESDTTAGIVMAATNSLLIQNRFTGANETVVVSQNNDTVAYNRFLNANLLQATAGDLLVGNNTPQGTTLTGTTWAKFGEGTGNEGPMALDAGQAFYNIAGIVLPNLVNLQGYTTTTATNEAVTLTPTPNGTATAFTFTCAHTMVQPSGQTLTLTLPGSNAACNSSTSCTAAGDGHYNLANTGAGQTWLTGGLVQSGRITGACGGTIITAFAPASGTTAAFTYNYGSTLNMVGINNVNQMVIAQGDTTHDVLMRGKDVQIVTPSITQNGTSGTATCTMGMQGTMKIATCYLNGYAETGTAQTYVFPTAFSTFPALLEGGSSGNTCGTYDPTRTASTLTLPANAAMTAETCTITAIGQ